MAKPKADPSPPADAAPDEEQQVIYEPMESTVAKRDSPAVTDAAAVVVAQPRVIQIQQMTPAKQIGAWTEVADAMKSIMEAKKLYWDNHDKKEPLVEAYTVCMGMLGVFPQIEWTRPITDAQSKAGWEARAVFTSPDGRLVAAGESQCTRSERNWARKDDNQVRSMAQTRAVGRAARMSFGFIFKIAGYDPTPAEEMDDMHNGGQGSARREGGGAVPPLRASKPPAVPPPSSSSYKSEPYKDQTVSAMSATEKQRQKRIRSALAALKARMEQHGDIVVDDRGADGKFLYLSHDHLAFIHYDSPTPEQDWQFVNIGHWNAPAKTWVLGDLSVEQINQLALHVPRPKDVDAVPF